MELSHGGNRINCTENPIAGAILALNASNGCGSKNNAWNWANDAVTALGMKSQNDADKLYDILNKSNTNFPNTAGGLEFVESLKPKSDLVPEIDPETETAYRNRPRTANDITQDGKPIRERYPERR